MKPRHDPLFGFQELAGLYGNNNLHLILDKTGAILEMSGKWRFVLPSVCDALSEAGHVRGHFDFPEKAPARGETATLRNKKAFFLGDLPEPVYTAFPVFNLIVRRIDTGHFYAALRFSGLLPNTYPQRSNGIVFVDNKGLLVGFNHTFFRFFSGSHRSPHSMLNRPVGHFMDPPVPVARAVGRGLDRWPDPALMQGLCAYDFDGTAMPKGIERSKAAGVGLSGRGLDFFNTAGDDFAVISLPAILDPLRNFLLKIDLEPVSGLMPVIYLDEARAKGTRFLGEDYSFGPDVSGQNYQLKRRGIIQKFCPARPLRGRVSWRLCRTGRTYSFFEQGERRLHLHDPNDIHEGGSRVSIALRGGAACRITRIRLFSAEKADPPPPLPVTRLKTPATNVFVVNPIDNMSISSGNPDISGFVLENATEMQVRLDRLRHENQRILAVSGLASGEFLGASQAFLRVKEMAARVAPSDVTVLLQGETGTGKEALARFIHGESGRREGPFVKVDCSTLPRDLIESELFGHERGAFTGAVERKEGLLEQGDGGTLLLDEIGNLAREVQAKLLHFLQDHSFTRIGGRKPMTINVRIIAASNVPLNELVRAREFRSDLYYRMEAVSITLPPLRDRLEDIPRLCRHFIGHFNSRHGRHVKDFSPAAYKNLFSRAWPGNVRELRNLVERTVIFCEKGLVQPGMIPGTSAVGPGRARGKRPLKKVDAEMMRALFLKHKGVARRVAIELGVTTPSLYDKIVKLKLTPRALRGPA